MYMNNKGEVSWEIPVSGIPTVEEREIWDRHPEFNSLQRSKDGWAWFTSNLGRLLPSYQDIEVEDMGHPICSPTSGFSSASDRRRATNG